jgi:uncharacterized membrane protein YgcG
MKLYGTIAVHVQAADILRTPKFFEKVRKAFGGKPDLRTGKMRAAIEATALVEASRDALKRLGANNAVSLVIDDTVLFHDRDGKDDDLGDLFLAFHDNSSVFGQGFEELRLAVEHREAGLHIVIEVQARTEHATGAPAIRIIASGRVEALTPKKGEDAEAYRKRAEPVAGDAKALELYRVQFESFVERIKEAIAAAMPTARAEVERAEARIVRPEGKEAEQAQQPDARYYDPYVAYYPSPLGFAAEMLMWSAVFSMMMPPHFHVVDHHNHVQGFADEPGIKEGPTASAEPATEASDNWYDGDGTGTDAAADADGGGSWWGGDSNDAGGDGGSWWGGGDSGGDGGGFDGGGGFFD